MQTITLTLTPADADCLVMLLAANEDHECEEHGILAAKWKQMLIDAGARPFPPVA